MYDELVPIKDEITRLRRIKTPKELEYIKQAEILVIRYLQRS